MTTPNSHFDDALYSEVHRLVTDLLQSCSVEASDRLSAFLADGGIETQRCYTSYMHETHALRSASLDASRLLPPLSSLSRDTRSDPRHPSTKHSNTARLVAFATIAAGFAVVVSLWAIREPAGEGANGVQRSEAVNTDTASVATLVRASRVVWRAGEAPLADFSRLRPGERIRIDSGQIEILFDTGVGLLITGRADAVIESAMRVVGKLGKFTALVSERGRGFTIETPGMDVIDLGTEFGVEIDSSGGTKVAVFQGEVDLKYGVNQAGGDDHPDTRSPERLSVGEAVHIDTWGQRRRLVAVDGNDFPTHGFERSRNSTRPVLFSAVRDNIRSPECKKFYRIIHAGLFDDARAYVDRNHEWNGLDSHGLPVELRGADYVMPFNDDKFATGFELTLEMSGPCMLYIFFNNNMTTPDWLVASFQDTGIDLGLDQAFGRYSGDSSLAVGGGMSIDNTFSVWARKIDRAGELRLGGVDKPDDVDAGWSMYGIAATPISANGAGQ